MRATFPMAALIATFVMAWGMAPALADPLTDAVKQVQGLLTKAEAQVDSEEARTCLNEAQLLLAEVDLITKIEQIQLLLEKAGAQADFDTQVLLSEARMLLSEVKAEHEEVSASPFERPETPEEEQLMTYP